MRNLIKLSCLAVSAILCASTLTMCNNAPKASSTPVQEKKIGIQLYSVMGGMMKDPKGSIDRLAASGYNVLELVGWGEGGSGVFGVSAAEFKAHCDKLGVEILSTHSSVQEDPTKEAEVIAKWRTLFETHKALGGKYFIVPSYEVDYTEAGVAQMCKYFNKIGQIAKEYGLKFGYHNHAQEFATLKDTDIVMWEYLVENTDPELVCFELDVFWCTKGGKNPVEYLKKYSNRIEMLHIKDDYVIGESGTIDFESIFKQFYANGKKSYVVEIESPNAFATTDADLSKYTKEQIMQEVMNAAIKNADKQFDAAAKSAEYLKNANFVK